MVIVWKALYMEVLSEMIPCLWSPYLCWKGGISSALQGPSSWNKNQIDMRHIDRRKSTLILYTQEIHRDMEILKSGKLRYICYPVLRPTV